MQISIDTYGVPLTEDALTAAKNADAVLFGAIGGPVGSLRAAVPLPSVMLSISSRLPT